MSRLISCSASFALLCSFATLTLAGDARSIALGGAVIANGKGVHGAATNPASLMAMQRRAELTHFRVGSDVDIRDTGGAIDLLLDDDNLNLIQDLDSELQALEGTSITCNPLVDSLQTVCVTGTQPLSDLSGRVLNIIDSLDGESLEGKSSVDVGMAFTGGRIPFAVDLKISAAGSGTPEFVDNDRDYINEIGATLDNNTLTLEELANSVILTADAVGAPLGVVRPEDILQSEGNGSVMLRTQLAVSFASTVPIRGRAVDIGITPKFSSMIARSLQLDLSDEFRPDIVSASTRFANSEVSKTSFTADLGASMMLQQVQVAGVIRNIIPESIITNEGFEFETTPQLIVGAAYRRGESILTADIALNNARVDNIETQKMGLGVELPAKMFELRGGVAHDAARKTDNTALTLGFGLGPLDFGARVAGLQSMELGAQLAFTFR